MAHTQISPQKQERLNPIRYFPFGRQYLASQASGNRRRTEIYPKDQTRDFKWEKYEYWLKQGYGACSLGKKAMAEKLYETFIFYDDDKYELIAWSIMPNHVHALIKTIDTISKIIQVRKSYTGKWAMKNNLEHGLGIAPKCL